MLTSKIRTSIITAVAALSVVGVTVVSTSAQAKVVSISTVTKPVVALTPTQSVVITCHVTTSCKLPTPTCSYEGREYKNGEDIEVFTLEDGPEVVEYGVTYDFLVKFERRLCAVGAWKTIETLYWNEDYKNGKPVGIVTETD